MSLITYTEKWYQRSWRPMMAFVYMLLCIIDYGIRPFINYIYTNKNYKIYEIVNNIKDLDPAVQIKILEENKFEIMKPILTEFVHLSFGAILGVAAFSRGASKNFLEGSKNNLISNNGKNNDGQQ